MCFAIFMRVFNVQLCSSVMNEWNQIMRSAPESHLSSFAPTSGLFPANPGILMWSFMTMMSPTLKSWLSPPAALVRMTVSTPISLNTRIGIVVYKTRSPGSSLSHIPAQNQQKHMMPLQDIKHVLHSDDIIFRGAELEVIV